MTKLLDEALEAVRNMPPDTQDSMAQAILAVARGDTAREIEPEHLPYILEGLAQLERGEFVEGDPAELVAAAFNRNRP